MSQHLRSSNPIQPLSIGNVVTAAFRLYRSHFKQYLGLTFTAVLWSLVPVYGWAKLHTINAMVSRLAFSELINKPESVNTVRRHLNPRMWILFGTQVLVSLILLATNICLSIPQAMVVGAIGMLSGDDPSVINFVNLILTLIKLAVYTWVYSRFFIPELPLAIETNLDVKQAISRSWDLTKGHVLRLQGIILLASLITLPIIGLALTPLVLVSVGFAVSQTSNSTPESLGLFFIAILIGLILFMVASIFVAPLWQAIKAVVYYDLCSRREGLDLKLRRRTT